MEDFPFEKLIEYISPERLERMQAVLAERTRHLTVVMENLFDPGNISAAIRSCDAFGLQDMHVIELDNPFYISRRITQGAHKWVNIYKYDSSKAAIDKLHQGGYKVYFADPRPEYPTLEELPLEEKTAIIFGQEKPGITDYTRTHADGGFRIPMYGFVESFNVSVTCALCLHTLSGRLRSDPPPGLYLSDQEQQAQFDHWLVQNTLIGRIVKKLNRQGQYLLPAPNLITNFKKK